VSLLLFFSKGGPKGPLSKYVKMVDTKTINDLKKHSEVLKNFFTLHANDTNFKLLSTICESIFTDTDNKIIAQDNSAYLRTTYPHIFLTMHESFGQINKTNLKDQPYYFSSGNSSNWFNLEIINLVGFYNPVEMDNVSYLQRNFLAINNLKKCSRVELSKITPIFYNHEYNGIDTDSLLKLAEFIKESNDKRKEYLKINKNIDKILYDLKNGSEDLIKKFEGQSEEDLNTIAASYRDFLYASLNQFPKLTMEILLSTSNVNDEIMRVVDHNVFCVKTEIEIEALKEIQKKLREQKRVEENTLG
jgi:hypothetical protein